jgi:hypothetical protein
VGLAYQYPLITSLFNVMLLQLPPQVVAVDEAQFFPDLAAFVVQVNISMLSQGWARLLSHTDSLVAGLLVLGSSLS